MKILILISILFSSSVLSLEIDKFHDISDIVEKICLKPSESGKYWDVTIKGDGGVKLALKLANISISGNAEFTKGEWKGIKGSIENNKGYRDCAKHLTPIFLQKFSSIQTHNTSRDKITQKTNFNSRGCVVLSGMYHYIKSDTTWTSDCYEAERVIIKKPAVLTIQQGVKVTFRHEGYLKVDSGAGLVAQGTKSKQIELTSKDKIPGYWNGVIFEKNSKRDRLLNNVIIKYGGYKNANLSVFVDSNDKIGSGVILKNVNLSNSYGFGFDISGPITMENVTSTNNEIAGRFRFSDVFRYLSSENNFSGNKNDVVILNNVKLYYDQKWRNYDVNYVVEHSLDVFGKLVVEKGVKSYFRDYALHLHEGSSLFAVGKQDSRIIFTKHTDKPWSGVVSNGANLVNLNFVTIEHANESGIRDSSNRSQNTKTKFIINNSMLMNNGEYGFYLASPNSIKEFSHNTSKLNRISGFVDITALEILNSSNDFKGNSTDKVIVSRSRKVNQSITINSINVPYSFTHNFYFNYSPDDHNPKITVRVNPGVKIQQESYYGTVYSLRFGNLIANGTKNKPIIFDTALSLSGDSSLNYVTVNSVENLPAISINGFGRSLKISNSNLSASINASSVVMSTHSDTRINKSTFRGGKYSIYGGHPKKHIPDSIQLTKNKYVDYEISSLSWIK